MTTVTSRGVFLETCVEMSHSLRYICDKKIGASFVYFCSPFDDSVLRGYIELRVGGVSRVFALIPWK